MPSNIYNAVPQALRDTRLVLRDIAQDHIASQNQQGQMELAQSRAKTDFARVQAESDKNRMNHEMSLRDFALRENESQARTRMNNVQTNIIARKFNDDNTVLTGDEYANRFGAKHLLHLFGINGQQKMTVAQWNEATTPIKKLLQTSPYAAFTAQAYHLKSEIEDLTRKYHQPGLAPDARDNIKKQIQDKNTRYGFLLNGIMSANPPDATKIAAEARKNWAEFPELYKEYPDFSTYLQAYTADVKKAHKLYHDDSKIFNRQLATMDIDPNYDDVMRNAVELIQTQIPDQNAADEIIQQIAAKQKSGDLQGAYNIAIAWQKTLTKQTPALSPGHPPAPAKTPQGNTNTQPWNTWDRPKR